MADPTKTFEQYLDDILNATYGQDVREAIYQAIQMALFSDDTFRQQYELMKADLQSRMNQLSNEEAAKEAQLTSAKNALMAEVLNLLNAMIYVNEKTGTVTVTGRDIKVHKSILGGETVTDVLSRSASNVVATKISGTEDDYSIDVTTGGLV